MKTLLKTKPIISFILITFLITFSLWFFPVLVSIPADIEFATIVLGSCGPLIAGLLLTVIKSEATIKIHSKRIFIIAFALATIVMLLRLNFANNGLNDINGKMPMLNDMSIAGFMLLLIPLFIIGLNYSNATNNNLKENYLKTALFEKGKTKWYLLAVALLVIISLISYGIGNLTGLETTDFMITSDPLWFVGFFSTFFFFGGHEEFGWRGFLQKELQKKVNPLITTLIISFLWSLWHLPLYYNGFYTTGGFADILPRFVVTIPLTIIFTWLYNKSAYTVMAVVLLHAMVNNVGRGFGSSELIVLVLSLSFAVYCVIDGKMWKKQSFTSYYETNKT